MHQNKDEIMKQRLHIRANQTTAEHLATREAKRRGSPNILLSYQKQKYLKQICDLYLGYGSYQKLFLIELVNVSMQDF